MDVHPLPLLTDLLLICFCSKTFSCCDTSANKLELGSKALNKGKLGKSNDGLLEKYRKVHDETVNIKPTNRRFRTKDHTFVKYDQPKAGKMYLFPKTFFEDDRKHTQRLKLWNFFCQFFCIVFLALLRSN